MRAVIAQNNRPAIINLPDPTPAADELLVRVEATALNRADLMQVGGNYPPPPGEPDTLGLELAGEIVSVGADVTGWQGGEKVMALVGGGGYAELARVKADQAMPIPAGLSTTEAAAIPEAFLTAYSNMIQIGRLQPGERVLIHAGASGVGLAGTQMASVLGAEVIVTASAGKHDLCRENGAAMTIDYKSENFAERILAAYSGVHLVVDMVGAPYWNDNVRVLEKWGRLVFVGLQGGRKAEVDFSAIMGKRLSIMGSTLRNRTPERKAALVTDFSAWALPHFDAERLRPNIWRVMPLDEVAAAHDLMRQNTNAGKIVLTI